MMKNNNGGGDNNNKIHGGERGPMTKMVFKIAAPTDRIGTKFLKVASTENGIESLALDRKESLLTVIGSSVDAASLVRRLRKKVGYAELISNGGEDDDGNGGRGDNNGNGGGNNEKKDSGSNGDSDGNDQDKAGKEGGGGGGGNTKGGKMDFRGEAGFDYRYGYHGGSENGCPTGQLQCPGKFMTTLVL